jgi:archaellum component FlaG (FlaF/FlaG flagellin family)
MKKSIISVLLVGASLVAGPMAYAKGRVLDSFMHKPSGYMVTVIEAPKRARILEGVNRNTGQTFVLTVSRRGEVTGIFEDREINFLVDDNGRRITAMQQLARN